MLKLNTDLPGHVQPLELASTIGFQGHILKGLWAHPDGQNIVFPLGNTLVVQDWVTKKQRFLHGHTGNVTCVAVSKTGRYIASGQEIKLGYRAPLIIWDYDKMEQYALFEMHKVAVIDVSISPGEKYVASLGGIDDGSVILWNIEKKTAVTSSVASTGTAGFPSIVCFTATWDHIFVTAGNNTVRVWVPNHHTSVLEPNDIALGKLKRKIVCMLAHPDGQHLLFGTSTGDILKVRLNIGEDNTRPYDKPGSGPKLVFSLGLQVLGKRRGSNSGLFQNGVLSIALLDEGSLAIGAGDGTMAVVVEVPSANKPPHILPKGLTNPILHTLKVKVRVNVFHPVTSVVSRSSQVVIGTKENEMWTVDLKDDYKLKLYYTCCKGAINDFSFPYDCSEVFATCSSESCRVWNANTCEELLRVVVPNMICTSVTFACDGKSIITGWNDGEIRAFTPQTGRLMYGIHEAHNRGVSCVQVTKAGHLIISGGDEGEVRFWRITPDKQTLLEAMKDHLSRITQIRITRDDKECVTSSVDGSCIIWDLAKFIKIRRVSASTEFRTVAFHPSEAHILTGGTDRKVSYWEVHDGSLIRELVASDSGVITTVEISSDGEYLISAGLDRMVKIWKYKDGVVTHIGLGHAAGIKRLHVSPDGKHIITVSEDGAIFRWIFPHSVGEPWWTVNK